MKEWAKKAGKWLGKNWIQILGVSGFTLATLFQKVRNVGLQILSTEVAVWHSIAVAGVVGSAWWGFTKYKTTRVAKIATVPPPKIDLEILDGLCVERQVGTTKETYVFLKARVILRELPTLIITDWKLELTLEGKHYGHGYRDDLSLAMDYWTIPNESMIKYFTSFERDLYRLCYHEPLPFNAEVRGWLMFRTIDAIPIRIHGADFSLTAMTGDVPARTITKRPNQWLSDANVGWRGNVAAATAVAIAPLLPPPIPVGDKIQIEDSVTIQIQNIGELPEERLSFEFDRDDGSGWRPKLFNHGKDELKHVLAVVTACQHYSELDKGYTKGEIRGVLNDEDISGKSPSRFNPSWLLKYEHNVGRLAIGNAATVLGSSHAGIWRITVEISADGYTPRIERYCFAWKPKTKAVIVDDPAPDA